MAEVMIIKVEPEGMDARSLDYVLGVEDCAMLVYDHLEERKEVQQLKDEIEELLDIAKAIRCCRFIEENGLGERTF